MTAPPPEAVRRRSSRSIWLACGSFIVLLATAIAFELRPDAGLKAYRLRARPEIILGQDKITPRKAQMLRMGLLKMSSQFLPASELASSSPAAANLFGSPCPEPDAARLAQDIPPSTALLPDPSTTPDGVIAVSVVCGQNSLFDPEHGIVIHPLNRGKDSERPAWLSARCGGELLLQSPVGLRIHGGHSRKSPEKSFTAVFRENYSGHHASPAGLFFGPGTPAARQFILLNAGHSSRFNGALAAEIAERLGCNTSRLAPALVHLNGTRLRSPYFLYQQQSPSFVSSRFGIEHPDWYRLKGLNPRVSEEFNAFRRWIRSVPAPMSMRDASTRFELEDLSAWALAIAFTATIDNDQGAYFRDADNPESRWRSLTWDLDRSFVTEPQKTEAGWTDCSQEPFDVLLGYRGELFTRLFQESPEYRDYFALFVREKLSEILDKDTLMVMADRYVDLARTLTATESSTTQVMLNTREFLKTRHAFFLNYLDRKLKEARDGQDLLLSAG